MDGISIMLWAYVALYTIPFGLKFYAIQSDRRLRFRNPGTRLEWVNEMVFDLLFNWRTLGWAAALAYLL